MNLKVSHPNGKLSGMIDVPLSKSILNRLLVAQAIGNLPLYHPTSRDANDVYVLYNALNRIQESNAPITIDVEDAGTPLRFLTAFCAARPEADVVLHGSERLKERPIKALIDALISLGADITYLEKDNFCPIRVKGKRLQGTSVVLSSNESSQFISALCLIAPCLPKGLSIHFNKDIVSYSYIEMTLFVLSEMGIKYSQSESGINIEHQSYTQSSLVMGDWSAASFFYSAALLASRSNFCISNLSFSSSQGDERVVELLKPFGVLSQNAAGGIQVQATPISEFKDSLVLDMSDTPDLAVPLMVAMACKYPYVSFSGIHHLRLKESDRILAIQTELKKLNIELLYEGGVTVIKKISATYPAEVLIETHNDHRIAMSFAMLALLGIDITIQGAECVSKSFPDFWEKIPQLGFIITEI